LAGSLRIGAIRERERERKPFKKRGRRTSPNKKTNKKDTCPTKFTSA
jgi:hypothetical protein